MEFLRKSLITVVLLIVILSILREWFSWNQDIARQIRSAVKKASVRYDIDPNLINAVIWKESRYQSDARGEANEIGLMQIRAAAAGEWAEAEKVSPFSHEHVTDIETNILAGSWYLAKIMKRYTKTDDPVPYALADYNAGRGNVLKWNRGKAATNSVEFLAGVGFPSTHQYIRDVIQKRNELRAGKP